MIKSSGNLPIHLDDLIHARTIESNRIEFKATWNDVIRPSLLKTVCAFANDLLNLNGGYIILGIEEVHGKPMLPPRGLDDLNLDRVQKEVLGACKGNLSAEYLPLLFVEQYDGKTILVIWVPAGDNKPYEARIYPKGEKKYYIRTGSETIEATGDIRRQLFEQAAKIPFDDRRCLNAENIDISPSLVRRHLEQVGSLLGQSDLPLETIYDKLRLTVRVNAHSVPRNCAILFFNEEPDRFFPGSGIEVVEFGDSAGDVMAERTFSGPLPSIIKGTLAYLKGGAIGSITRKVEHQAVAERTHAYSYEAIEEAVVNAVYHRGYDYPTEPIKVYIYLDRIEITSYPGPVNGIELSHFNEGNVPSVPARNRRIGEFLKEERLAERRGTGVIKMRERATAIGAPLPMFDFDKDRTYFRVIFPVHPEFRSYANITKWRKIIND